MANRVVISRLVQYIIVEGPERSPPRSSHGVVDAARDTGTLVGSGVQGFVFPSSWMNKGTLCISALVGPSACAIADCCDDDRRQVGPSDTDS
eukprot:2664835-Amphidinium_carterae.2